MKLRLNRATRLFLSFIFFALVAMTPVVTHAQAATTGSIEGIVSDASGGVLPGVAVVVKNMDTNVARDLVTDEAGRYRATALQPGRYEVSATLAGFQAAPIGGIVVQVGQTAPVDVKMHPAGVSETVEVNAEAPQIDTRRTDVGNVIGQTAIQNLPINGRRWENFVLLSPGVTNDGGFGLVSYRGISGLYNNNSVDGVDNNQAFFSEARGRTRTSYSVSQAAIREFQVGISNFSAEFGRAAGGSVNAVTKSGTNNYAGEGFYYLRSDKFEARDAFAIKADSLGNPIGKPKEKRQQFGFAVGGPVKHNKIFFFANYDGQRRDFPVTVNFRDDLLLSGTAQTACTAPGCAATIAYYQSLKGVYPRSGTNDVGFGKVDFNLSQKNNLSVQYNMHRWNSPNGVQTPPVITVSQSANGTDIVKTDFFVASLNTILSPSWLNEARVQVGRDFEAQTPNAPGVPSTSVSNGPSFGMPNFLPRAKFPDERRYEFIDNISHYMGSHGLKAGVDINYVQENLINLFSGGGVYSYGNLQSIAADCPALATGCTPLVQGAFTDGRHYNNSGFSQAFDLRGSQFQGDVYFPTTDYNAFVQDTWKVNNLLTLNLGVRYEYQKLPQPGHVSVRGVVENGNPAYPATMTFNQDKNNFGPRIGFTYDWKGEHRTVFRGGWGIYYGRTSNSQISSALTNNAVTLATYTFSPATPGAPQYPNVLSAPPTTSGSKPSINYLAPDLQRPQIYEGELTVDRALSGDITVSASYLYSRGTHLPLFYDSNLPVPTATVTYVLDGNNVGTYPFYRGARPDPNIGAAIELLDVVKSQYNAMVLQFNKRYSHGLLFNANYTLSKATDTGQNSTTFFGGFPNSFDPNNPDLDNGTSDFDRRHRLVTSAHYAPAYLYGVQFGVIGTFESGLPISGTISAPPGNPPAAAGAVSGGTNGSGGSFRAPFDERNAFRQPGRKTIDLRVSKVFNIGGTRKIEALAEAFNLFNWTNFTAVTAGKYTVTSSSFDATTNLVTINLSPTISPLTGKPTFLVPTAASNTLFGARDAQIGLRFIW
ncbi:MAG TPA: TonB-dependent receptor [Vicinamibacterales bacterium]|nr:TonB-dependent receptor [Vicinamibacterales bacterium]